MRFPTLTHQILSAALAIPLAPALAAAPTLARTDLGPLTTEDLELQIRYGEGLRDDELGNQKAAEDIAQLLRSAAFEQILLHLADEHRVLEDPAFQAYLDVNTEDHLLRYARATMIQRPAEPTAEEIDRLMEEAGPPEPEPAVASWRHMLFVARPEDSEQSQAQALNRLRQAREALASREDFEAVARRLATPPAEGEPGALVGPTRYAGRVFPAVEEALDTLPIGEVSDPIETPLGPLLLRVESRGQESRRDPWFERRSRLVARVRAEKFLERQREVYGELQALHPVQLHSPLAPDMPDDTVALTVGERTLTLGDLRRRCLFRSDPDVALRQMLTLEGLEDLGRQQLLLIALEEQGVSSSPEMQGQLAYRRRFLTVERMIQILVEERDPTPTAAEALAYLESHPDRFTADLVTVQVLRLSRPLLSHLSGSDLGIDHLHFAEQVRDRWTDQAALVEFFSEHAARYVLDDELRDWIDHARAALPTPVRRAVAGLQPGQVSVAQAGSEGLLVVRLVSVRRGVPRLEDIRFQVDQAIRAERAPSPHILEDLLEQHGYTQLVDGRRLRWGEDGHLILAEAPE